jgi:hypothetical protein
MRKIFVMGSLALAAFVGSVPEPAAACSCAELWEQVDLELVTVEAVDGGDRATEVDFWPSQARLVRIGSEESFDSEALTLTLQRRSSP